MLPQPVRLPEPNNSLRTQTFGHPLLDKHVSGLAPPIKRTATLDEYMKQLGTFTFNEPLFMENMENTGSWLTVPEYVYGRKEQHLIPSSRFATYCKTVLTPMIEYLMNAQIRWDSTTKEVAVIHGGEYGIRETQKSLSDTLLPQSERGQPQCLRHIIKHKKCTLNDFFNLTAGTEAEGRIPVNENIVESGQYPVKRKLTILGHTPMTLAIPCIDEDPDGNKVIHMDTQTSDRSKCSSCVAWNTEGHFMLRFSLPVPECDSKVLAQFHKPNVFDISGIAHEKTRTMIFHATSDHSFRRERRGMRFAGHSNEGFDLYVKANVPDSFDSSVNVYELREATNETDFTKLLTHATWGDVEGNLTFLNGCIEHLTTLRHFCTDDLEIVCMGDIVGPAALGHSEDIIDEAACIKWANTTDIKLVGNRDFNKLRLVPEYVFWKYMTERPDIDAVANKSAFVNSTFPVKPNGDWLHGKGTISEESITKSKKGGGTSF